MKKLESVNEFFSHGDNVIRTFTGKFVDPFNMTTDDVDLEDIAHGLSNICRFGGQTKKPIPVLAHILIGYNWLYSGNATYHQPTDEQILHWLLHDATEAYIGDIPSPIKKRLYGYQTLEDNLRTVIFEKFGILFGEQHFVQSLDGEMLNIEVLQIVNDEFVKYNRKRLKKWFIKTVNKHYTNIINTQQQK